MLRWIDPVPRLRRHRPEEAWEGSVGEALGSEAGSDGAVVLPAPADPPPAPDPRLARHEPDPGKAVDAVRLDMAEVLGPCD